MTAAPVTGFRHGRSFFVQMDRFSCIHGMIVNSSRNLRGRLPEETGTQENETMEYLFETTNLKIRKFCPEDAQRLYEIHQENPVGEWIPNERYADLKEAEGAVNFYANCVDHDRLPYVLAVESKLTGELIGDTGINEVEGKPEEVEIGYVISEAFSGKGYATELVEAMTELAFRKFEKSILYGRVMRGNDASVRVLEKNGYSFFQEEIGAEDDPYGQGMLIYRRECPSDAAPEGQDGEPEQPAEE